MWNHDWKNNHLSVKFFFGFFIFPVIDRWLNIDMNVSNSPGGEGGHSLICPIRVCAAEQDMAFRVFNRYTILLLSVLNRVRSFWTGSLSKSVKTCDERSTFEIPIIVFLNIYFHDFSVKNYLILYAKHKKSGSESSVSCLKQASEMSNFCLKQGRSLKASEAQLYPDFPWVPPPRGVQLA